MNRAHSPAWLATDVPVSPRRLPVLDAGTSRNAERAAALLGFSLTDGTTGAQDRPASVQPHRHLVCDDGRRLAAECE
jgi:hypothetical protein